MKLYIATGLFAATACATTSTGTPTSSTESSAGASLSLKAATAPKASSPYFPTLVSKARLPSVDRKSHVLRAQATQLDASVRICVAPDGRVASVDVDRSSGVTTYDRLLAADIATWQYESFAAPAHLKVCQRVKVSYLVR